MSNFDNAASNTYLQINVPPHSYQQEVIKQLIAASQLLDDQILPPIWQVREEKTFSPSSPSSVEKVPPIPLNKRMAKAEAKEKLKFVSVQDYLNMESEEEKVNKEEIPQLESSGGIERNDDQAPVPLFTTQDLALISTLRTDKQEYLKLDYAYKSFLRGIRRCIKTQFINDKVLSQGFYHWRDDRLLYKVRLFISQYLSDYVSADNNAAVQFIAFLLYPARATISSPIRQEHYEREDLVKQETAEKQRRIVSVSPFFTEFSLEDIKTLEKLFLQNSSVERKLFFSNGIVRALWPYVIKHLTYEDCFPTKQHSPGVAASCGAVTYELQTKYFLDVPQFWLINFPPVEFHHNRDGIQRRKGKKKAQKECVQE